MRRWTLLIISCLLCCASFVSCAESQSEISSLEPEPSVELEASPSPTPEPRTEVKIPEELKFCDGPLYYGMTIEEAREALGGLEELEDKVQNWPDGTTHSYFYNIECLGQPAELEMRTYFYNGLMYDIPYGLSNVSIRWTGVSKEEKRSFEEEELRPIVENLYGEPNSEYMHMLFWQYPYITIGADKQHPEIVFFYNTSSFLEQRGLKDEAKLYEESGKQGITSHNLNCLQQGMSFDQVEVFLGPYTAQKDKYTTSGAVYATFIWEDEELWNAKVEITFCNGEVHSIYSRGI